MSLESTLYIAQGFRILMGGWGGTTMQCPDFPGFARRTKIFHAFKAEFFYLNRFDSLDNL